MFDFFTHLHSKTHRKTLDPYERPWASSPSKAAKSLLSEERLTKPAKGTRSVPLQPSHQRWRVLDYNVLGYKVLDYKVLGYKVHGHNL
ncbi:zinc finger protein 318-like [Etheostoma cragini]|uniref:zinc finger protein 318-like n=1 Tax=Etheostoma cragini TaxID=417921 RepID=UPI00155E2782|nr:zinc finger protein 318-like [Etheostoma cragini]